MSPLCDCRNLRSEREEHGGGDGCLHVLGDTEKQRESDSKLSDFCGVISPLPHLFIRAKLLRRALAGNDGDSPVLVIMHVIVTDQYVGDIFIQPDQEKNEELKSGQVDFAMVVKQPSYPTGTLGGQHIKQRLGPLQVVPVVPD